MHFSTTGPLWQAWNRAERAPRTRPGMNYAESCQAVESRWDGGPEVINAGSDVPASPSLKASEAGNSSIRVSPGNWAIAMPRLWRSFHSEYALQAACGS